MSLLSSVSGCALFGPLPEEHAESAAHELLEAVRVDDVGSLSEIMSQSALNAPDLVQGFQYASSLLDKAAVYVGEPSIVERHTVESGKSALSYTIVFEISASDQEYCLRIEYYYKNDFDKSKIGIYRAYFDEKQRYNAEIENARMLRTQADANNQPLPEWNYGATYERPGIYHPGWKEEDA